MPVPAVPESPEDDDGVVEAVLPLIVNIVPVSSVYVPTLRSILLFGTTDAAEPFHLFAGLDDGAIPTLTIVVGC